MSYAGQRTLSLIDSYGTIPLVYSTSTQNNERIGIKPFQQIEKSEQQYFIPLSMQSSQFTFNKNNIASLLSPGQSLINSKRPLFDRLSNNYAFNTASKQGQNNGLQNLLQTRNLTKTIFSKQLNHQKKHNQPAIANQHKFTSLNYPRSPQLTQYKNTDAKQQLSRLPSRQILLNQHNYSFHKQRSSLHNFGLASISNDDKQNKYDLALIQNHDKQNKYGQKTFSQYQFTPRVIDIHPNNQNLNNQNQNSYKRQYQMFGQKKYDTIIQDTPIKQINQNDCPQSSQFMYRKVGERRSFSKLQNTLLPPAQALQSASYMKHEPSITNFHEFKNSQSFQSTRLLNRDLTQLKSDMTIRQYLSHSNHYIQDDAVQQFPIHLETNPILEKEFHAFCCYKGRRVVFQAEEKPTLC